jgi:L-erythro-3,5-diaminohexanoate dehydrogenase
MAMQFSTAVDTAQQLGADRVISPGGSLPQRAERLDASGPARPYEFEIAVERLCLDSTSHRNIREGAAGDPERMADRIREIVAERGKLHNPETDSGGVLLGTVSEVGDRFSEPPEVGDRVVTLSSMTLTPLRVDEITGLAPDSPQVEATGSAYVFERGFWAHLPEDLPLRNALEILDVCSAANQTRDLTTAGSDVCVLGAGHAGKLAMAAARDAGAASVTALDVDAATLDRVESLGLCDTAVVADLRDPVASLESARAAGAPESDLTISVVNVTGCEPTAILLTAEGGTALFFAMSTSFSAASLAGDGIGTKVNMLIGSGYTPDRGAYALDLVRGNAALREALGMGAEA